MADDDCTGRDGPAKTLSYEDRYPSYPAVRYGIGEPERPAYSREVSETARRLAKNVRLLRTARGWSQETLASHAGLDRTFVGAVERAERNVTVASVEKLANALNMTVADLLRPYDI